MWQSWWANNNILGSVDPADKYGFERSRAAATLRFARCLAARAACAASEVERGQVSALTIT